MVHRLMIIVTLAALVLSSLASPMAAGDHGMSAVDHHAAMAGMDHAEMDHDTEADEACAEQCDMVCADCVSHCAAAPFTAPPTSQLPAMPVTTAMAIGHQLPAGPIPQNDSPPPRG